MERASQLSCPSFWKLLMEDDFNRGIRIPHSFSNHLERRKCPCNYSLITEDKKRSSDRSWRAKLVKKDHYFYLCKKSWPEFVRDHNLKYGDLLLFHLVDKLAFRVIPYGADGCIKKLDDDDSSSEDNEDSDTSESESDDQDVAVRTSTKRRQDRKHRMDKRGGSTSASKKVKIKESDSDEDDDDERRGASRRSVGKIGNSRYNKEVDANSRKQIEGISNADEASKWDNYFDLGVEKPYFIRTIKNGHKYSLVIPRPFARATDLNKVKEVELLWEDGGLKRSWTAKMIHSDNGRVDIGDGWSDFRQSSHIRVGETCHFSVSNRRDLITISVHVFRFGPGIGINDGQIEERLFMASSYEMCTKWAWCV